MGLFGSSVFTGLLLSSIIFPPLADTKGRKYIFVRYFSIHMIGVTLITFAPSIIYVYVGLFLVGLGNSVRTSIGYIYCLEFLETKHH